MSFTPRFCPYSDCPSRATQPFLFRRRGFFERDCDHRVVPRFFCLTCSRTFSEQTFRVDYRLKRPELLGRLFLDRISKVTHRQSARNHACSRTTEERHFRRLSTHCKAFHDQRMAEVAARGGLGQVFLLDELETYEHHRTEKPVTVPILIERHSGFVLDARPGALASRQARDRAGPKNTCDATRRRSESRRVVKEAFERLRDASPKDRPLYVLTDLKPSYGALLEELFGTRCIHRRTPSGRKRDLQNPLWPINHTLARVRDNVSRLVRETWAAAKQRAWLAGQLAIWVCYRNYIRGRTNREPHEPPAMHLGVQTQRWSVKQLLEWRIFPFELAQP